MIEFWFWFQLWTYLAAGVISLLMTAFSKVLHSITLIAQMAVVVGLALQALLSTILAVLGQRAATSTLEFFGYLVVALMVSVGAIIWGCWTGRKWSIRFGLMITVCCIRMTLGRSSR
jgi:hypothetical protein